MLLTRYAPFRRSPAEYCYSPLPLDLHVLSLPLAFILSQDQTLLCIFYTFSSIPTPSLKKSTLSIFLVLGTCLYFLFSLFKELSVGTAGGLDHGTLPGPGVVFEIGEEHGRRAVLLQRKAGDGSGEIRNDAEFFHGVDQILFAADIKIVCHFLPH